jgi:cold shock CspA family protein
MLGLFPFTNRNPNLDKRDRRYVDAKKLWDNAKEQNFSYEERIKRQFIPRDPSDSTRRRRFSGKIQVVKPGYVLIQPEDGPLVISATTVVNKTALQRFQKVTFELTFSAKGPFAENLQLSN